MVWGLLPRFYFPQLPQQQQAASSYSPSNTATKVDEKNWGKGWKDNTASADIKEVKDGGKTKIFSFKANLAVDSDGDTPNVLGRKEYLAIRKETRDAAVSAAKAEKKKTGQPEELSEKELKGIYSKADKEAMTKFKEKAKKEGKFYDADKLDGTAWQPGGKNLNADKIPYVVVPPEMLKAGSIKKGDFVLVKYNGKETFAVVGDVGPARQAGEASMETARRLGMNPHPSYGGRDDKYQDVEYIVLPGSRDTYNPKNKMLTADEIQAKGKEAFEAAKKAGYVQ